MVKKKKYRIAIINGPNMNILGIREPEIYGTETWNEIEEQLRKQAVTLNIEIVFFQSNHEGELIDFIQANIYKMDGVVINPSAFTKTGYGILDALTAIDLPFVEVHMSNISTRENWHSETIFASKALGHIHGFSGSSYYLGLLGLYGILSKKNDPNEKKGENQVEEGYETD